MEEYESNPKWRMNPKKVLVLIAAALLVGYLLCAFAPGYVLFKTVGKDTVEALGYVNLIDLFARTDKLASVLIPFAIYWVLALGSLYFLARSFLDVPFVGDKEDKHFVFGFAVFVLAHATNAVTLFVQQSIAMMAPAAVLTAFGLIALVVHFRVLSDV